ncbi:MAG: sulfotransferase [Planctomycetota bacterium]
MPSAWMRHVGRAQTALRTATARATWPLLSHRRRDSLTDWLLGGSDNRWLFIIGAGNSGTTLLTRILRLHPAIRDLPWEGARYTRALHLPGPEGVGRVFTQKLDRYRLTEEDDAEPARRVRFDWAWHYPRYPGWLLEKSPVNSVRARWLQANFQPARFIVLTRSPYAVCEGIRRRSAHSVEEAATHWAALHDLLEADLPRLEHVLQLTYERICEDPRGVVADLEVFLDLPAPFDPARLDEDFSVHNMDGATTPIRNFNDKSIGRLRPEERRAVTEIAGAALRRWGYQPLDD